MVLSDNIGVALFLDQAINDNEFAVLISRQPRRVGSHLLPKRSVLIDYRVVVFIAPSKFVSVECVVVRV